MQDLKNNLLPKQSLAPAARTADASGTSVDLNGFGAAMVLVEAGAWTDGTHTFEVQESDDDATFTAVADADLQGAEPVIDAATEDNTVHAIGYIGDKRYIRVAVTVAGATTGMVSAAHVVLGNARHNPVA